MMKKPYITFHGFNRKSAWLAHEIFVQISRILPKSEADLDRWLKKIKARKARERAKKKSHG